MKVSLADDTHEMSRLIFHIKFKIQKEKKNKKKNKSLLNL